MQWKYEWKPIRSFQEIKFDYFEGIAKISINRPEVHNAFTPLTVKEMITAMDHCRDDEKIQVAVITGEGGRAFCSGGDQTVRGHGGYVGKGPGSQTECVGSPKTDSVPSKTGNCHGSRLGYRGRTCTSCGL